jgi:hypothetical protein
MSGRMLLWILLLFAASGGLALAWQAMAAVTAPATKITVLDEQAWPVRTITSEGELARFNELWSRRADAGSDAALKHFYKVQVVRNGRSDTWFYDPAAGLTQILAVVVLGKRRVYRLPAADFNTLLGVT